MSVGCWINVTYLYRSGHKTKISHDTVDRRRPEPDIIIRIGQSRFEMTSRRWLNSCEHDDDDRGG